MANLGFTYPIGNSLQIRIPSCSFFELNGGSTLNSGEGAAPSGPFTLFSHPYGSGALNSAEGAAPPVLPHFTKNSSGVFPVCFIMYRRTKTVTSRCFGTHVVQTLPSQSVCLNVRCFLARTCSKPLRLRTLTTSRRGSGRSFMDDTSRHMNWDARESKRSCDCCRQVGLWDIGITQVLVYQILHVFKSLALGSALGGEVERGATHNEPLALSADNDRKWENFLHQIKFPSPLINNLWTLFSSPTGAVPVRLDRGAAPPAPLASRILEPKKPCRRYKTGWQHCICALFVTRGGDDLLGAAPGPLKNQGGVEDE